MLVYRLHGMEFVVPECKQIEGENAIYGEQREISPCVEIERRQETLARKSLINIHDQWQS